MRGLLARILPADTNGRDAADDLRHVPARPGQFERTRFIKMSDIGDRVKKDRRGSIGVEPKGHRGGGFSTISARFARHVLSSWSWPSRKNSAAKFTMTRPRHLFTVGDAVTFLEKNAKRATLG